MAPAIRATDALHRNPPCDMPRAFKRTPSRRGLVRGHGDLGASESKCPRGRPRTRPQARLWESPTPPPSGLTTSHRPPRHPNPRAQAIREDGGPTCGEVRWDGRPALAPATVKHREPYT